MAVDAALDAVREALAGGMDWRDLARMVKEERRAGNPVASLIDSLQASSKARCRQAHKLAAGKLINSLQASS